MYGSGLEFTTPCLHEAVLIMRFRVGGGNQESNGNSVRYKLVENGGDPRVHSH